MKRGEVWWVQFDPALGSEIKKTRPAIIISNDATNRNLALTRLVGSLFKPDLLAADALRVQLRVAH